MLKIIVILLFGMIVGACGTAKIEDGVNSPLKNNEDKVVCTIEKPTGSRLGKKICMTKKQRKELQRRSQENLDRVTMPQSNNPTGQ